MAHRRANPNGRDTRMPNGLSSSRNRSQRPRAHRPPGSTSKEPCPLASMGGGETSLHGAGEAGGVPAASGPNRAPPQLRTLGTGRPLDCAIGTAVRGGVLDVAMPTQGGLQHRGTVRPRGGGAEGHSLAWRAFREAWWLGTGRRDTRNVTFKNQHPPHTHTHIHTRTCVTVRVCLRLSGQD